MLPGYRFIILRTEIALYVDAVYGVCLFDTRLS